MNKTALITGANKGIGLGISKYLDLSGCDACWLYRANGEYFTCKCSAAHAFERYEQFRKEDSHALLARIAGDAAEELC